MRVHVVDPSAYTPPYDHALCSALAAAGADVELYTSRFAYDELPPARCYQRNEFFYRGARLARGRRARRLIKLAEHVPDMLRYRRAAAGADVVHFQWLSVQPLDGMLLPSDGPTPLVLTAHDILPREPWPGQRGAQRRLYERFDAIVVHSAQGRERLTGELGLEAARVHVIPHGALSHLTQGAAAPIPLHSPEPVVLFFGLLREYKGLDVLLAAWRGIEGAQLWIAGMPRMNIEQLRAAAPENVRFDARYLSECELRAYFRRADLVVLPYREIDQSGVLLTALAFGKPLLVSDIAGLGEVAANGAARAVPAGDVRALHDALESLLGDRAELAAMGARATAAAGLEYSWKAVAGRTLALYEELLSENPRR